jgi:hypothetical protein
LQIKNSIEVVVTLLHNYFEASAKPEISFMKYRKSGNTGIRVSAAGPGCMSMSHVCSGRDDKNSENFARQVEKQ